MFKFDYVEDDIDKKRGVWESKKILQVIYNRWFKQIKRGLRSGETLEIGGGTGTFKEFYPESISSDIVFSQYVDIICKGEELPFKSESLSNLVCIDVIHHIKNIFQFLYEVERVLVSSGRLIILEPFISLVSGLTRKAFQFEDLKMEFDWESGKLYSNLSAPTDANLAVPTILFYRDKEKFEEKFTNFRIRSLVLQDFFAYPLSGGYNRQSLLPQSLLRLIHNVENFFFFLRKFIAFKIFIIIERK